ncbi:MAG: ATP-dependent DNA ligase [Candidatus Buchananbacteria bacterium]|nr:ATP-dependent DNA ligase [Candidatus Buchananbacteria bacterium]
MTETKKVKINKKTIELSNLDKTFYPEAKYNKGDVIDYYDKIADFMLPHLKNRLVVMQRFPDGIKKSGFYQKETPDYFPVWIKTKKINLEKDGKQELVIIEKKADLVYLANQGTLIFHIWLSQKQNVNKPNKLIFDLDPPPNSGFKIVKFAAYKLKDIFEKKKLNTFVMTTGSKGLHVIIPIKPKHDFDKVREFAKKTAEELADKYPDKLTTEVRKEKRKGRILLDYLRNAFGQTGVAPYSLRAIKKAPIATPIDWSELSSINDPQKYNLSNIFKRLGQKSDPWKKIYKKAKDLKS